MSFVDQIKFNSHGLVPAIIQDYETNQVLMMAYMNKESLWLTIETGKTHFYSRSRNKLWLKGEESGHFQFVKSVRVDCDEDCLLIKVEQVEAACHTNNYSCFYREVENDELIENSEEIVSADSNVLKEVYDIISDRKVNPKEGSYTNYLFTKGIDKILKKVGEECAEVIIGAKNNDKAEICYETSDLLYHLMVMMVEKGLTWDEIHKELEGRK